MFKFCKLRIYLVDPFILYQLSILYGEKCIVLTDNSLKMKDLIGRSKNMVKWKNHEQESCGAE